MTGEEEYEEILKGKKRNIGGKSQFSSKRSSYAKATLNDEEPATSKFTQRLLDKRNTKVEVSTDVFGKPDVLIRNQPNLYS